tara:strand:+ start:364 stop:540 length:177 start_codon:yes stop_codon:yes gene_type:complete
MKKIILILLLLSACSIKKDSLKTVSTYSFDNIFELTINEYKQMLYKYNSTTSYPNIEK